MLLVFLSFVGQGSHLHIQLQLKYDYGKQNYLQITYLVI